MRKELEIKGEKFFWSVEYYGHTGERTHFYRMEKYKRPKYFIFGDQIEDERAITYFTVGFDVTDPEHSKEWVRERVEQEYEQYVAVRDRKKEIDNGEII